MNLNPHGIMVDLETYGRRPGCAILSIGAVAFDPAWPADGLGERFHCVLSLADSRFLGFHEDPETVAWWSAQSPEARETETAAKAALAPRVREALRFFAEWRSKYGGPKALIYGNGSDFDNTILAEAYRRAGIEGMAWPFWQNRCYRTLKGLAPHIKLDHTGLTHHNAVDDAVAQARHAVRILRLLSVRHEEDLVDDAPAA